MSISSGQRAHWPISIAVKICRMGIWLQLSQPLGSTGWRRSRGTAQDGAVEWSSGPAVLRRARPPGQLAGRQARSPLHSGPKASLFFWECLPPICQSSVFIVSSICYLPSETLTRIFDSGLLSVHGPSLCGAYQIPGALGEGEQWGEGPLPGAAGPRPCSAQTGI